MTTTQQPETLVFADDRPTSTSDDLYQWAIDAEDLIRAQHARIEELEALLSAIGAGGVEPLRKSAAPVSPVCFALYDSQGFYETRDTEQQCIDFCKHYNARDARLGGGLAPYTHGALYAAPQPPAQEVHPESIREGVPYDNPAFEQLARDMGVWGTTQSAVCAQFWLAATQPAAQGLDADLTDAQIDEAFNQMPDGAAGFLKSWGYRQFARAVLAAQARNKKGIEQ